MVKHNMVIGLPKVVPPNGVCEGYMVQVYGGAS